MVPKLISSKWAYGPKHKRSSHASAWHGPLASFLVEAGVCSTLYMVCSGYRRGSDEESRLEGLIFWLFQRGLKVSLIAVGSDEESIPRASGLNGRFQSFQLSGALTWILLLGHPQKRSPMYTNSQF